MVQAWFWLRNGYAEKDHFRRKDFEAVSSLIFAILLLARLNYSETFEKSEFLGKVKTEFDFSIENAVGLFYRDCSFGVQSKFLIIICTLLIFADLFQVLVAIDMTECQPNSDQDVKCQVKYKTVVQYFDAEAKTWNPLPSVAQMDKETQSCFCAEYVGNYLYIAAKKQSGQFVIYSYHIASNAWETLPPFPESSHKIDCLCSIDDYVYAISESNPPQRYSMANNNWQKGAQSGFKSNYSNKFCAVAAVVLKCKVYVIHGKLQNERNGKYSYSYVKPAVVHCFDPAKNEWKQKASTCRSHFGSSLFVVNDKLYVAGGKISRFSNVDEPCGDFAPVEVYNEENNTWSVVEQKRIPPNNLGAVEIEGRVYFIINKFPIDSGIRIPPEELYPVHLGDWENLGKIDKNAVLCYLPVKRESLKTE